MVYYTRQLVEQYFGVSKGISRLTPLRVHTEQRVLGHLLLSQIAATINLYIQKKMHSFFEDREEMFMGLRNQKCIVYVSRIITNEGQSGATQYYNKDLLINNLSDEKNKRILLSKAADVYGYGGKAHIVALTGTTYPTLTAGKSDAEDTFI